MTRPKLSEWPRPAWSHDEKMILITMAENFRVLWDTSYPFYRELTQRKQALEEIYQVLSGKHTVEDINAQWRNLKDVFHKKKAMMEQHIERGQTPSEPMWRYYAPLKFLLTCEEERKNNLRKRFQGSYEIAQLRQLRYRRQSEIAARRKQQQESQLKEDQLYQQEKDTRVLTSEIKISQPYALPQPLHTQRIFRRPPVASRISLAGSERHGDQETVLSQRIKHEEEFATENVMNLDTLSKSELTGVQFTSPAVSSTRLRVANVMHPVAADETKLFKVKEEVIEESDDVVECADSVGTHTNDARDGGDTDTTSPSETTVNGEPSATTTHSSDDTEIAEMDNLTRTETSRPSVLSQFRRWQRRQLVESTRYSPYQPFRSLPSTVVSGVATATVLAEENGDINEFSSSATTSSGGNLGGNDRFKYFAQYVESAVLDVNQQAPTVARRLVQDIYAIIAEHQTQLH